MSQLIIYFQFDTYGKLENVGERRHVHTTPRKVALGPHQTKVKFPSDHAITVAAESRGKSSTVDILDVDQVGSRRKEKTVI